MEKRLKFLISFLFFLCLPAYGNVVGSDVQNFNPITSGLDFVTVHSSETLKPGVVNWGFFLNYAINSLPNYEDQNTQTRTNFDDTLFSSDLNIGLGLMPNWDVGFSVPQIHAQSVESQVPGIELKETGVTEYRLNTKYRFWGEEDYGVAMVASVNLDQTANNPFVGEGSGPTYNLELVGDMTYEKIAMALNIGYRFRQPGDDVASIPIEPYRDQVIASVAGSYLWPQWDTKIIGEIFTSFPTQEIQATTDRDISSAELLVGGKTDINRNLAIHYGGGTELFRGMASPSWRVYTGLNWSFGPLFSQNRSQVIKAPSVPLYGANPFAELDIESEENFVTKDVFFGFDSFELQESFRRLLVQLAEHLNRPPEFKKLVIEGHSDSIGKATYNLDLSRKRAEAVRQFLIQEAGLSPGKIQARGLGENYPIADNGNYQGRALNRRVEFRISR